MFLQMNPSKNLAAFKMVYALVPINQWTKMLLSQVSNNKEDMGNVLF